MGQPSLNLLLPASQFGLRTRIRRATEHSCPNYDFENERKAFKKTVSEYRAEAREQYWQMQTQIENKFFEDYRKERHEKQHNDLNKWRTKIIRIAQHTKRHMDHLDEREKRTLKAM